MHGIGGGRCGPSFPPFHTHIHMAVGLNHTAAMLSRDTEKAFFHHPVKNLGARLGR